MSKSHLYKSTSFAYIFSSYRSPTELTSFTYRPYILYRFMPQSNIFPRASTELWCLSDRTDPDGLLLCLFGCWWQIRIERLVASIYLTVQIFLHLQSDEQIDSIKYSRSHMYMCSYFSIYTRIKTRSTLNSWREGEVSSNCLFCLKHL